MWLLDVVLLILWLWAGIGSYLTGSDALYKLFLWLLIGFLAYLLVAEQVEVTKFLSPADMNGYQRFLWEHATGILTMMLLMVPFLGIFFMFNKRLSFDVHKHNPSSILLWLLLPIFLIGILAYLASNSILSENDTWWKIFSVFEHSVIFQFFEKSPWIIFLVLGFLICYKSIFLLMSEFSQWVWKDVISTFFTSWDTDKKRKKIQDND